MGLTQATSVSANDTSKLVQSSPNSAHACTLMLPTTLPTRDFRVFSGKTLFLFSKCFVCEGATTGKAPQRGAPIFTGDRCYEVARSWVPRFISTPSKPFIFFVGSAKILQITHCLNYSYLAFSSWIFGKIISRFPTCGEPRIQGEKIGKIWEGRI